MDRWWWCVVVLKIQCDGSKSRTNNRRSPPRFRLQANTIHSSLGSGLGKAWGSSRSTHRMLRRLKDRALTRMDDLKDCKRTSTGHLPHCSSSRENGPDSDGLGLASVSDIGAPGHEP